MRMLRNLAIVAAAAAVLGGCAALGKPCKSNIDCGNRSCVKMPGSSRGFCQGILRPGGWTRTKSAAHAGLSTGTAWNAADWGLETAAFTVDRAETPKANARP